MATGRHRLRLTPRQRIGAIVAALALLVGGPLLFLTHASDAPASAAPADASTRAISWAQNQQRVAPRGYYMACLQFVYDAYRLGAGIDTRGGMATNSNTTAYQFWQHFPQLQHKGDANPPAGAFVFWAPNAYNSAGHVALSLGGQRVISTAERTITTIHTFSIADRARTATYLGWMMPPGVNGGGTAPQPVPQPQPGNQPVYPVMNTSETPPDGVWFRDNPNVSGPRLNGYGVYNGDRVQLRCYGWGESIGRYNDRLWYYSTNLTRPNAPGRGNTGWLNAHYVNDGQNANAVVPGVRPC